MSVALEPVLDEHEQSHEEEPVAKEEYQEVVTEEPVPEPKKRGRPKKVVDPSAAVVEKPKRGRPKKTPPAEVASTEDLGPAPTPTVTPDIDIGHFLLDVMARQRRDGLVQQRAHWQHMIRAKL